VIIAVAYKEWGIDFIKHLEGEFSCAIWDDKEKRLILIRDPYGHKPLHYYADGKTLIFSSEIKGILTAGVPREMDLLSLSDFLTLNCIPCPSTIFKDIKQVEPGNIITVSNGNVMLSKYWDPRMNIDNSMRLEEAIDEVGCAVKDSVRKRLIGNEHYCFLSGGIDSSAIVAFASELSSAPINAVCIGFQEDEVNELEFAKIMADHVGAKLHYVVARPDSFLEMLDTLVFHYDSPFTDTSAYPSYYAGKLGCSLTDIILTGDGPDQTMGGSSHHVFAVKNNIFASRSILRQKASQLMSGILLNLRRNPGTSVFSKAARKLYRDSLSPISAAYDLRSFFPDIIKTRICTNDLLRTHYKHNPYRHPESWFKEAGDVGDINKYLYADIKFYITDDLMIKVDRMCMAHGLETLSPFQDIQLAKIVNRLPSDFKIDVTSENKISTKHILKKICEKRFPPSILYKKKQGFGIPLDKWLRYDNGSFIQSILLDKVSLSRGYFNSEYLRNFIKDFIQNKGDYFYPSSGGIVALLTLELWHRKFIDASEIK